MEVKIREVTKAEIDAVKDYILEARRELYPMLDSNMKSGDLDNFEKIYLQATDSKIFIAVDAYGKIIGSIGLKPYDNRHSDLNYSGFKTAEVVKLYVDKEFRQNGIGTVLVQKIVEQAILSKYNILYLHTHPFLKGALLFWKKNGFRVTFNDVWNDIVTIHMDRHI